MLLTDTINIKEVMLFPAMKPDTNAHEEEAKVEVVEEKKE
jgi:hypothetical protein